MRYVPGEEAHLDPSLDAPERHRELLAFLQEVIGEVRRVKPRYTDDPLLSACIADLETRILAIAIVLRRATREMGHSKPGVSLPSRD
jgi:hypothetical protein